MKHAKIWFNPDLTSPEKLVFMAIAAVNDDAREAVTVGRLAIMTSLSRRSVQASTKRLRQLGKITVEQREQASSLYRVIEQ
jgi:hypothetical protein